MSTTYPIGIIIKGKFYVIHSIYVGDYFRPSGPWYDNADLVANLTDNSILLKRRVDGPKRRKLHELTKEEQRKFRQAKDITALRENTAFFKKLRN